MRRLTVTFEDRGEGKVSVMMDLGVPGTDLENTYVEVLKPFVITAIENGLPATIVGYGKGRTMDEAKARANIETDIRQAGEEAQQ